MTGLERVDTAMRRRTPDRVPAVLYGELIGYVPAVTEMLAQHCGKTLPRDYFGFDITAVSPAPTRQTSDFSAYLPSTPGTVIDEWGVGWEHGDYLHYARILHSMEPLTSTELREYPFPDLDADYRYENVSAQIRHWHDNGLAAACFPGSIFEQAWFLRGMPQLFADIANAPEDATFLLDRITDIVAGAAARLAAAGLDLLILGDDIATQNGMMMSLDMYRAVFKPRLTRVIHAAKDAKPDIHVFYHSDGNVWDAIPDLIDAGITVLNPVQPECVDPAAVKREFGDRLAFFGTMSVQRTFPFGTPDDVKNEVKLRMETIGNGGGLLLAPTHVLQPDTPWENIVAFFQAIEEYGYYG